MKKKIILTVFIALIVVVAAITLITRPKKAAAGKTKGSYEFTTVTRGDIESVVSSSGTLSAVSTVSILSQMSGQVEKVYVDYNDRVKKGQVLVVLNTDMLRLEEKENQAAVDKAKANYDLQLLDYENKKKLFEKGLVAEYDFKSSKSSLDVYAAELASAKAALSVIQTQINQYAFITSPINGIVLDKNVDVGQSVVTSSSSNASSLFTLAESLSKMEIKAEVDELDISSIKKGQEVRFTVEAQPNLTFKGTVSQILLVPETSDNVVTYYVKISADNMDEKLLPGMTATVEFIKEQKKDVLLVPSAAFRFKPTDLTDQEISEMTFQTGLADMPEDQRKAALEGETAAKAANGASSSSGTKTQSKGLTSVMMGGGAGGPPGGGRAGGPGGPSSNGGTAGAAAPVPPADTRKTLWYLDDAGKPAVLLVQTGASDSLHTEIVGKDDLEGKKIILKVRVQ
jgi:HlyD family secretion protein